MIMNQFTDIFDFIKDITSITNKKYDYLQLNFHVEKWILTSGNVISHFRHQ